MALTHVELYEALKPTVGEQAARLMANVIPPAEELTTKYDLGAATAELKGEIADVKVQVSRLEAKIEASSKDTMRWMLAFFIPVWAGTWGTVIAVLLKH
jgi:hypothetical protein